ncbi:MAG TPA: hypothetical protein VMV22_10830 [Acidimicrobiales bacterium]|nr:hypothetical protein [Acidimicrobiales bacterium]
MAAGVVVALGVAMLTLGASAAFANTPNPVDSPPPTGSITMNSNGSVTLNVSGTWVWPYSNSYKDTQGIHAMVNHPCDRRIGGGWGITWNDPNDTGTTETYTVGTLSATVNLGSRGTDLHNTDNTVTWNHADPCGTFVETDTPVPGAGYVTGSWGGSHTYAGAASLPSQVCVVMYDLGSGGGHHPKAKFRKFSNQDNTVAWTLVKQGSWPGPGQCVSTNGLPQTVAAVPTTTAAPAKVVANTPPAPVTKPSGSLAFTGLGPFGRIVAVLGALLVIVGAVVYFVDVRKLALWLLGL